MARLTPGITDNLINLLGCRDEVSPLHTEAKHQTHMADGQPATQPSGSTTESRLRRALFHLAMSKSAFHPAQKYFCVHPTRLRRQEIKSSPLKIQTTLTSSTLQLKFLLKNGFTSSTSRLRSRIPPTSSPLRQ